MGDILAHLERNDAAWLLSIRDAAPGLEAQGAAPGLLQVAQAEAKETVIAAALDVGRATLPVLAPALTPEIPTGAAVLGAVVAPDRARGAGPVTVTRAVLEDANLGDIARKARDTRRVLTDPGGRVTARREADICRRKTPCLGLDRAFACLARCLQHAQVDGVAGRAIRSRDTLPCLAGLALIAGAGLAGSATAISGAAGLTVAVRRALGDARAVDTLLA